MSHAELATSVDDVLTLLRRAISLARDQNTADGYFPLVYLWETEELQAAADGGGFAAPAELRRMIVGFANRYFSARAEFAAGRHTPRSWALAFRAARTSSALVLQHLLLGMNAHINVDLAAAAAETGITLADYSRVDAILGRSIDRIQRSLNRTTPVLRAIDLVGGRFDEALSFYSLRTARRCAFTLATELGATPEAARPALIAQADARALELGLQLLHPPLRDRLWLAAVRLSERNLSPRQLLALLERA